MASLSGARTQPSGRGRATLALDWWPDALPSTTTIEPHTLIAHDGEVSRAVLYRADVGSPVVCLMHPRQDMQRHPLIPHLVQAGISVWAQNCRDVGNDLRLVHESALLDVAAGMERVRELGFERVTLAGVSGGAGLYSFYAEQALLAPAARISATPAGTPVPLGEAQMPSPDALALVAPHPGQGRLLMAMIDPSVTMEDDLLSLDPSLDPYDEANGFGEAPEGSSFSAEFMSRYREAQRARVARIDDLARDLLAARLEARARWKGGSGERTDQRASIVMPIIITHRTDADPRCTDLSLDPSDRPYGSVISPRPALSNYGPTGFGRLTTPEAWLSTWSGISSNASLERALPGVSVPTLVVEYTGDCSVFPSDVARVLGTLNKEITSHVRIRADHFGRPLEEGKQSGIPATADALAAWVTTESAA